jgi:lipopolysaccharide biosynthesis regulator YciM
VNSAPLFILIFVAIAIGWLLGRQSSRSRVRSPRSSDYYKGLNYLLDGHPDGALDEFIESLEVSAQTFETHISLGNLLRKKGEVQRAIRVHENVLAHGDLPAAFQHEAHLELARDYIAAGLLDRAEQLLLDLIGESEAESLGARRYLIEIYQMERDWDKAIAMASSLLAKRSFFGGRKNDVAGPGEQSVNVLLPHFYCELAEVCLQRNDVKGALEALAAASREDPTNVRVTLMRAQIAVDEQKYEKAIELLGRVEQQDAEFLPEVVPLLGICYTALGQSERYGEFLRQSLEKYPTPGLMIALADHIKGNEGVEAAAIFLTDAMRDAASLRGLYRLMLWQLEESRSQLASKLEVAMTLMRQLTETSPAYRCQHCGFRGQHLHWFCPGCKFWGSIKPIGLKKTINT